jgi:hypothetical protein
VITQRKDLGAAGDVIWWRVEPPTDGIGTAVANTAGIDERAPDIATLADGSVMAVYQSSEGDGSGTAVMGRRILDNGSTAGAAFVLSATTLGDQKDPAVATLAGGDVVVAFREGAGTLWTRRFGKDGKPAGIKLERLANQLTPGNQDEVAVAATPDGLRGLIAWSGQIAGGDGLEIRSRLVDGTGKPVGAEFGLNSTTADNQHEPAVAGGVARFVSAWTSDGADQDQDGVVGRLFDDNGKPVTGELVLNTTTTGTQESPAVAVTPGGLWLAVWRDDPLAEGFVQPVIRARGFDKSGKATSDEVGLSIGLEPYASNPCVANIPGTNEFIAAWHQSFNKNQPNDHRIKTRKVGITGTMGNLFNGGNSQGSMTPTLAIGTSGGLVCARSIGGQKIECGTLNLTTAEYAAMIHLHYLGAGPFVPNIVAALNGLFQLAWHRSDSDGSGFAVQSQAVTLQGYNNGGVGARVQVNRTTAGNQRNVVQAPLVGGMLSAWSSAGQDGSGTAVVYRVLPYTRSCAGAPPPLCSQGRFVEPPCRTVRRTWSCLRCLRWRSPARLRQHRPRPPMTPPPPTPADRTRPPKSLPTRPPTRLPNLTPGRSAPSWPLASPSSKPVASRAAPMCSCPPTPRARGCCSCGMASATTPRTSAPSLPSRPSPTSSGWPSSRPTRAATRPAPARAAI